MNDAAGLGPARRRRQGARALLARLRARPRQLGRECSRADERWWKEHRLADPESWRRGASKKFYAAVEIDSRVEGYALYRVKDEWQDGFARGEVRVIEALATSPAAEAVLWRFLHEIDLTVRVDAYFFDPGSPLPLLVRDSRALGLRVGDGLWLRLVDLDAALKARSYRPGQSVVLEVTDELCPWNAGRYRVGDDAGRTEDTADLALDVADLASVYLGALRLPSPRPTPAWSTSASRAPSRRRRSCSAPSCRPYCPEVF